MSNSTATLGQTVAAKWAEAKPILFGLVIGLIVGPILSGISGFQIRSSTAAAAERASIVEQQASFCAERARAALPGTTAPLDWQARNELARRWAVMPGATTADPEVAYACSGKLPS